LDDKIITAEEKTVEKNRKTRDKITQNKKESLLDKVQKYNGAIIAVATIISLFTTLMFVLLTYNLLLTSTDPQIELLGSISNTTSKKYHITAEKPGIFGFILKNEGINDIKDIEIYVDLLHQSFDGKYTLPEVWQTLPIKEIEYVKSGSETNFQINLNDKLQYLTEGEGFRLVNIRINYKRDFDGKVFFYDRTYNLTENNNDLLDNDVQLNNIIRSLQQRN